MSAIEAIARLRELSEQHWAASGPFKMPPNTPIEELSLFGLNRNFVAAAAVTLPALLDAASQLEKLTEAASCIRHWHDAMADGSGMVVSAEHVRKLWDATEQARAALQALAGGGGE